MKESRHPVFELELLPIAITLCVLGEISKKLPKRVLSGQRDSQRSFDQRCNTE